MFGCAPAVINDVSAYINSDYTPLTSYSSRENHYCMIDGKHYFDLNVLSDNGTMNKIADNIPYGNPFRADIYGIETDGEYLYCCAMNLWIDEDNEVSASDRTLGIYKIDVNAKTVQPLYEWESPPSRSNIWSLIFEGDYIYFFMTVGETNDICRIKKDGTDFEKLTANNEIVSYGGLYFAGDAVYYNNLGKLYKTTADNLETGELIYENIHSIELYKDYFYCKDIGSNDLYRINAHDPTSVELIISDINADNFLIKDDIIYYAKYDPIVLFTDTRGIEVCNTTQGQIFTYDINTKENKKLSQNSEICYNQLCNISDNSIIACANTNQQYINSAENAGLPIEYYIIPLDGSEAYQIKDLTLSLQGT